MRVYLGYNYQANDHIYIRTFLIKPESRIKRKGECTIVEFDAQGLPYTRNKKNKIGEQKSYEDVI
jgi:hypothetical protein